MTIAVTLDSRFNTLNNGSQRIRIRQNTVTKEREAVVNVTFTSDQSLVAGTLQSVNVTVGGTNYVDGESVTLTGGTSAANNAVATISVTAGAVTAVNITNPGSGYTLAGESITILGAISASSDATATGNVLSGIVDVDFTGVRGFTKVYAATIINSPLPSGFVTFIRSDGNDDSAENGSFLFLSEDFTALTTAPNETYDVVIRGV